MKITVEKKVVTDELGMGNRIITGIIVLSAVYFSYQLEYPADVKLSLLFLQEKLLQITAEGKLPMQYCNFFRAISCVQNVDQDDDMTQDPWHLDTSWY